MITQEDKRFLKGYYNSHMSLKSNKKGNTMSKLIGKIAEIKINTEAVTKGTWGIITYFDGDLYHITPFCDTLESAKDHSAIVFDRKEFKVKRK